MRKSFVALLLIIGAAALANLAYAAVTDEFGSGEVYGKLMNAQMAKEMRTLAAKQGAFSHIPTPNDTTYVGYNPAYSSNNYWSIGVGNRHPNGTIVPPPNAFRGYWDWESPVHGDSLQGWWPVRNQYTGTGGLTLADWQRPWWAIDIGNQISLVVNQGPNAEWPWNGGRRTFGVTSAWHSDAGITKTPDPDPGKGDVNPSPPRWTPLAGSRSAWCGLRSHGDVAENDPITGNPYNIDALEQVSMTPAVVGGSGRRYPGYASQWDQMLYRDIDLTGANPSATVSVSFLLRTRMSTSKGTALATRTGWFDKDPLENTIAGGGVGTDNFISSTVAGASAPIDSFMVYVGVPVGDAVGSTWLASDGSTRTVFDPIRRWFGELIRASEAGKHWEVYTSYGNQPAIAAPADSNLFATITANRNVTYGDLMAAAQASNGNNKIRLVFRVKTNRGFDDNDGSNAGAYTSGYQGAAQLDDVAIDLGSGPVSLGGFENASDIDNNPATPATSAWKTSSKPPAAHFHVHQLSGLTYQDLCGPPGSISRICNMWGGVISMGDHDLSEAINGVMGTAEQETYEGMLSPTINLLATDGGAPNNMGLTIDTADPRQGSAIPTEDFYLAYEIYTGVFDLFNLGAGWQFLAQSYPAAQADGQRLWGETRAWSFQYFNPDKQCFDNLDGMYVWGLIRTVNPGNQPDSLRISLRKLGQCYRFGITTACGSTDGAYFDNVALAIVDGAAASPVSVDIWEWINDTFPANENPGLPGLAAFDTTTALIKTGRNDAPTTGDLTRYDVPSDSTLIQAAGDSVEVQLVFRILPGPGNYHTAGDRASGLRAVATSPTVITPTDGSFWSQYILDNGKGTPGGHPAGTFETRWSELVWNTARCDTAEQHTMFPVAARNVASSLNGGVFASTYHELDPKYNALGMSRHKCFLNDTLGSVTDITCTTEPAWVTTVPASRTGYDGNASTVEGTKILPDGLLTPGSHVEYFFVRKDLNTSISYMCPDTNLVSPQNSESSTDAHRWQEFSVLPDAWKFSAYNGLGKACMLYVDWNDRRGNERIWVSTADSIGATTAAKYGAHNGWHGMGGADVNSPAGFVYNLNQQPGTTWDMFGIKASESLNTGAGSLGARLAYRGTPSLLDDKWAKNAPTTAMLEAYYRVLMILTGDLNSSILGPFDDKSSDDEGIINSYLLGATAGNHRGIWIMGDGFVESLDDGTGTDLVLTLLQSRLTEASYLRLSGDINQCPDLTMTPIIKAAPSGMFGFRNLCLFTNDVLGVNGPDATPSTYYGSTTSYPSGIFKDAVGPNYWQALTDGWNIFNLRARFCDTNLGRLGYFWKVFNNVFGKICAINGTMVVAVETPQNPEGRTFVDFASIGNNPLRQGEAYVNLTLAKSDRVEVKIYDVSGRLIRTLADGQLFKAGPQKLTWDGLDNGGRQVARGVYFTHIKFANSRFENNTKMVVLK
jgi:hypothetical protein